MPNPKLHICSETPCPVRDQECAKILENGFKTTVPDNVLDEIKMKGLVKDFWKEHGETIKGLEKE